MCDRRALYLRAVPKFSQRSHPPRLSSISTDPSGLVVTTQEFWQVTTAHSRARSVVQRRRRTRKPGQRRISERISTSCSPSDTPLRGIISPPTLYRDWNGLGQDVNDKWPTRGSGSSHRGSIRRRIRNPRSPRRPTAAAAAPRRRGASVSRRRPTAAPGAGHRAGARSGRRSGLPR